MPSVQNPESTVLGDNSELIARFKSFVSQNEDANPYSVFSSDEIQLALDSLKSDKKDPSLFKKAQKLVDQFKDVGSFDSSLLGGMRTALPKAAP